MIKQQININGVPTMMLQSELTRKIIGQDEEGNDILGDFYKNYNEDMAVDTVKEEAEAKVEAVAKANTEYEVEVAKLTEGVPDSEKSTWTKQESEARAYQADSTVVTPFIDSLSASRGVPKNYLVGKIIEKSDAYAIAIGTLTGARQKAEDEIG